MDLIFGHRIVSKYMTPEVRTLDESDSVMKAIEIMTHYNISCLVITRKSQPVGIVTERDLMRRVALEGKNLKKSLVKDVMSSPLISKTTKTKVDEVVGLMNRYGIRRIVVMDDDELKGIITQTDIVRMSKRYIEIIDVVKLYFYLLMGIGVIAAAYLLVRALV